MTTDEDEKDWSKLTSVSHITTACRRITRLWLSLRLALLIKMLAQLPAEERNRFLHQIKHSAPSELKSQWGQHYETFVKKGCKEDANFALHVDMLHHMHAVVALHLAEKAGGSDGYNLLMAHVKGKSLLFSYVNSSSSYAALQTRLLIEDAQCGIFYRNLKRALFSHPFREGGANCGLDTLRELDHIMAVKAFRGGCHLEAALSRMACVSLLDLQSQIEKKPENKAGGTTVLGLTVTQKDVPKIIPVVTAVLRCGGFYVLQRCHPQNLYSTAKRTAARHHPR